MNLISRYNEIQTIKIIVAEEDDRERTLLLLSNLLIMSRRLSEPEVQAPYNNGR